MTNKQKKTLWRILIAGAMMASLWLVPIPGHWVRLGLYLVPYLIVGWDVLWKSIRNIGHGQIFDENFLMSVATVGALAAGILSANAIPEEYPEAVAVMLFYQVGELFQSFAVGRSRRSITALMDIRPDWAAVERDGATVRVSPDEVAVGETIVVKAGEKIPLDGTVLSGTTAVDTAALTGESLPRDVSAGDAVISGCVNLTGLLRIRTDKVFGESTVSRILDLVENSSSKKARAENFITRFSRWYTPVVVLGALAVAVIPSLVTGQSMTWIMRGLTFLVVSCPCALVISVPLTFFGGIGGASKKGILVKGGNYLEALAKAGTVVFDKTGTLTRGTFQVTAVHPQEISKEELLMLAALAESYSNHPISRSLRQAVDGALDETRLGAVEETPGHGVTAQVDGRTVHVGNDKMMERVGAPWRACHKVGTIVHVAVDGTYMGHIVITDTLKDDAAQAVKDLRAIGVRKSVMLTGDNKAVGEYTAAELGIDEVHAQLLPAQKVEQVERLLQEKRDGETLLFVGDGVNDAPVLSRSDVGIAMGAFGSDAAIEAADVVLMDDAPSKIPVAIAIAKKTVRIVRQNIVFSLAIKGAVLALSAVGIANMWWAVFADVGVMILAVLNASRMLGRK